MIPVLRSLPTIAVVALMLLAGCLGTPESADLTRQAADVPAAATPPTVVAVVDSGINPYHEAFHGGSGFDAVPGLPATARALDLTLDAGSYEAAVAADADLWDTVGTGDLIWFPGTRLAAVSITHDAAADHAALDTDGHGTAVSHAVLAAAPHAVVVMVQAHDDWDLPAALEWVAEQDWIDVVSVSWGSHPHELMGGEVGMGIPDAHAKVAASGKILLNSAGNYPAPQILWEHSAPPSVIAVGGARLGNHGDAWIASKFPDIVSEFVHEGRAVAGTLDGYGTAAGTSLACPEAAGAIAESLWLVRDAAGATRTGVDERGALVSANGGGALADGQLTAAEVRDGINRTAVLWGVGDWSPPAVGEDPLLDVVFAGVPVVAPAAQMGWGYVGRNVSAPLADHLLGVAEVPAKPAEVQAFMAANLEARRLVWDAAG